MNSNIESFFDLLFKNTTDNNIDSDCVNELFCSSYDVIASLAAYVKLNKEYVIDQIRKNF